MASDQEEKCSLQPFVYGYPITSPGADTTKMTTSSSFNDPVEQTATSTNKKGCTKIEGRVCACLGFLFMFGFLALLMLFDNMDRHNKPEVGVKSILVSPFNISSRSQLTANWTIEIFGRNPNAYNRIFFDSLEVSIFYRETRFLAKTTVSPQFIVQSKEKSSAIATPGAYMQDLSGFVSDQMAVDLSHGFVNFDVKLHANVTFQFRPVGSKTGYSTDLLCQDLKVSFSSNDTLGTMVGIGGPSQCLYTSYEFIRPSC